MLKVTGNMAAKIYIDAIDELNAALAPFNLVASIREVTRERDRWSQFLTTGKERDLEGQKGHIYFERRISDELTLNFGAYFPRFEYEVSQSKTLYYVHNGKRLFDGIRRRGKDESPTGWLLSGKERAIFTKWYNTVTLRHGNPS